MVVDALDAAQAPPIGCKKLGCSVSSSSEDGDNVSSVTSNHEQSGDVLHEKINVLHVAVGGVMWRRWGEADQNHSCRYRIPHDNGVQLQARIQKFVHLCKVSQSLAVANKQKRSLRTYCNSNRNLPSRSPRQCSFRGFKSSHGLILSKPRGRLKYFPVIFSSQKSHEDAPEIQTP